MARHLLTQVLLLCVPLALLGPGPGYGQETPETEVAVTVSSDAGESETLTFGLDPDATDGIDSQFGESELPPVPPQGVFDVRWIDTDIPPSTFGQGLLIDIRQGNSSFNGTRQHEIQFQTTDSATEVTFEWDLPTGITGTIEDKFGGDIYQAEMDGSGSLTVNPGDPEAILTIDYNAPPTLETNEGATLNEGGQVSIPTDSLSASDPDDDPSALTFTVTDGPTEGDLLVGGTVATEFTQQDLIDGQVAYDHTADVPPGEIPANDEFTFDLTDSKGEGPAGNVFSVTVLATNDPPTAESDADTTQQGTTLSVSAPGVMENDSDPDGDLLSVSKLNGSASDVGQQITLASGALLTVEEDGAYSYAPNGAFGNLGAGETETDSFTYTVGDGNGGTDQATVTLTVEGVNDAPVGTSDDGVTDEGNVLSVTAPGLLGNDSDPDGDPLSVAKANGSASDVGQQITLASGALLTVEEDGAYSYAPNSAFEDLSAGETGADSFTYTVGDGNGGADQVTVTLTIEGGNSPPVAEDDIFTAYEDSTLSVSAPGLLGNDEDPEGDPITPSVVSAPGHGTLTLNDDGSFEYVPEPGFSGTDSFTYEVSDGNEGTDQATVALEVNGAKVLSLADGWNLLSIPYQLDDQTFGSVLPSCTSGFFFEAGTGYQSLTDGDPLPVGEGFWAKCTSDTVEILGQEADSKTVGVAAGWNLIGPLADSVDSGSITSEPSGIVESSFFRFDQSSGYTVASTLVPGEGYWVNADQAGTLDLSGEAQNASLASASRRQNGGRDGKEKKVRLQLTDREGQEATLRLWDAAPAGDKQRYELPPTPPGNAFDIRFEDGSSLATWGPGASGAAFRDVQLQGVDYPMTLRLRGRPLPEAVRVQPGPGAPVTTLTPESPSMTVQSELEGLQVAIEAAPDNFALEGSAPNPAREQATIRYRVPKQVRVRINLYDILGRKLKTLVEGERRAGQYSVRVDVRSLPSGRYFYRMSAGRFSRTQRLSVVQ